MPPLPSPARRDPLFVSGAILLVMVVVTASIALLVDDGVPEYNPVANRGSDSQPEVQAVQVARAAYPTKWGRDNGVTGTAPLPPEEYGLPHIPNSRPIWYESGPDGDYWGFISTDSALEIGVAVLEHYQDGSGWRLESSEVLDISGNAWGGILVDDSNQEVVAFIAIAQSSGEQMIAGNSPTRVSVARIRGVDTAMEVLGNEIPDPW